VDEIVKPRRAYDSRRRGAQAQQTRRRVAEAARSLFLARGYTAVTMADIAKEADVAYQTVYAVFGSKLRLTQEIIWTTFEVAGIDELLGVAKASSDPEDWVSSGARITRLVNDHLAGLLRFLQESGDPDLLTEYRKVEARRREQQSHIANELLETGRLRSGLTHDRALDILWVLTGSHIYEDLVTGMGWTPDQYETWLGDTLISQLLAERRR
jgi:AcrR family transcriptional regulator